MAQELATTSDEDKKGKIVENVIGRVNELALNSGFSLPDNYAVENALRAAYFMIGDVVNKDGKSALDTCTVPSIKEALFRMAAQALDPIKSQCYFIAHGSKLTMRRSYFGSIAIAKRVAKVKDVTAAVIFEGDGFDYEMQDGRIVSLKHQQKFGNLDNEMVGAYCIATLEEGTQIIDVMTIAQIKKSWKMSSNQGAGNKLQNDYGPEAAKRTVVNRCLKPLINSSDDANLFQKQDEEEENAVQETTHTVVNEPPKSISLPVVGKKTEQPKPEPVKVEPKQTEPETIEAVVVTEEENDPFGD